MGDPGEQAEGVGVFFSDFWLELHTYIAKCALYVQSVWEFMCGSAQQVVKEYTKMYRLCVDGARRGNGLSSGGMAVWS